MLQTEERSVRIKTADGLAVDGIVRVRRFGLHRGSASFAVERHDPVAVVVERHGRTERIHIPEDGAAPSWRAWIAAPIIAGVVTRVLRAHRKRDG